MSRIKYFLSGFISLSFAIIMILIGLNYYKSDDLDERNNTNNKLSSLSSDIEGKGEIYDPYLVETYDELFNLTNDWSDINHGGTAKRFIRLEDDILYTAGDNDKTFEILRHYNASISSMFTVQVFLDLNGHDIRRTGRTFDEYLFHVKDGGSLFIYDSKGGSTLSLMNNSDNKKAVLRTSGEGKLTLVNVDVTFDVNTTVNHEATSCVSNNGGIVKIYGGTFRGDDSSLSATMGQTYIYGGTFLRQEESIVGESICHFNIGTNAFIEDEPKVTSNGTPITISGASNVSPIEINQTKPHIAFSATRDAFSMDVTKEENRYMLAVSDTDNISWKLKETDVKIEEHKDIFEGTNENVIYINEKYTDLACALTGAELYACSNLGDNETEEYVATLDGISHKYTQYVELEQSYYECEVCGEIMGNTGHNYSDATGYGYLDNFYGIIIGDTPLYKDKPMPDGVTYEYDTENKIGTLTLNNFIYEGDGVRVLSQSGKNPTYAALGVTVNQVKLVLKGNSKITLSDKYKSDGIVVNSVYGKFIIEGDGSLTINGGSQSVNGIDFPTSGSANYIQNGADVTFNNFRYGLSGPSLVQINDGTLTLNGNCASNSQGIICIGENNNIEINGGRLEVKNFNKLIYCALKANFIYNSGKFILDSRDVANSQVFAGQFNEDTWPDMGDALVYYQGNFSGDTDIHLDHFSDELNIFKYTYVENLLEYDLYVGGTRINEDNQDDLFGDGKVSYDPETNTLTLSNYSYTGKGYVYDNDGPEIDVAACIYAESDLIINLIGENHINPVPNYIDEEAELSGIEISNSSTLIFKGTGSLIMDSNYVSIYAYNIIIKSGTFNIKGLSALAGYESLVIEGGQLLLTSSNRAIPYGSIELSNYKGKYDLIVSRNEDGSNPEEFTGDHFQVIALKYLSLTPKASYNITIDINNGISEALTDVSYGTFELPECTFKAPEHMHFKCYLYNDLEYAEKENITIDADSTIKVIWEYDSYKIVFNANGGKGEMSSLTKEYNSKYLLPVCLFNAPDNMEFNGWEVNGVLKKINDEITITDDVVIKASWVNKEEPSESGSESNTESNPESAIESSNEPSNSKSNDKNNTGMVIGVVLGIVIGISIIGGVVFFIFKKRK